LALDKAYSDFLDRRHRLVMLPHESHGYTAKESVLHVQAETIAWLNRYVRDAGK
jgi:dipeptidyl aminopeptidase/acylaminoacyl peptidase